MSLRLLIPSLLVALALVACGGDDEPSGGQPAAQPTTPPQVTTAPQATTAPTAAPRPLVINQTHQTQLVFNQAELAALFGSTPYAQSSNNVSDVRQAYASSTELGDFLTSQQATGLYNAWRATTAQCVVCTVQVSTPVFPTEAAATQAYQRVQQVNQAIFQNVAQAANLAAAWDSSFCQNGTFASGGQTLNWLFCAARKNNAVITIAVGGFNFNPDGVLTAVRTAANRMDTYLRTQQ